MPKRPIRVDQKDHQNYQGSAVLWIARWEHGLTFTGGMCVLNDTDVLLRNMGVKFSRYVDDFRIAVPAGREAHSILCQLAEHLMVTEGLSLNVTKTRLTTVREVERSAKARVQDVFTTAEMEKMEAFITVNYGDENDARDEDAVVNPLVSAESCLRS